ARTDSSRTQMRDVRVDEVDRSVGSTRLCAGLVERLRDEVHSGDLPSVLGQVDRGVPGAASGVQRRSWRQCVSSLDEFPQRRRLRMTVPWGESDTVEDPKQSVPRSHHLTVILGDGWLKLPEVGREPVRPLQINGDTLAEF